MPYKPRNLACGSGQYTDLNSWSALGCGRQWLRAVSLEEGCFPSEDAVGSLPFSLRHLEVPFQILTGL